MSVLTPCPVEAARYLVEKMEIKTTDNGKQLMIWGDQCRSPDKVWEQVESEFFQWCVAEKPGFTYVAGSREAKAEYQGRVRSNMLDYLRSRRIEHAKLGQLDLPEDYGFDFTDIGLVSVIGETKRETVTLCVNRKTDQVIPARVFSTLNLQHAVNTDLWKELLESIKLSVVKYDPSKPQTWMEDYMLGGGEWENVTHYNEHVAPKWKLIPDDGLNTELDPLVLKALSHLVPDEEQLEYLLDAIHFIVTKRLEVYLVLSGSPGIGKSLLYKILRALLGERNVRSANVKTFRGEFNSVISKTRLVVLDEYAAPTSKDIDALKKTLEEQQSIQLKFQDAQDLEQIHATLLITVNKGARFAFEPNERKFSVLDCNDIPLNKAMSGTELDELHERLREDLEFQASIGYFFLNRNPVHTSREDFKGERFWQMVVSGLTGFERFMYMELKEHLEKGEISKRRIMDGYNDYLKMTGSRVQPPTQEEIDIFLDNWDRAGKSIAKKEIRGNKIWYLPIQDGLIDVDEIMDEEDEADWEDDLANL